MNPELEGLDLLDLLDLLEMPPDPAQIPYTPQTAGWLVVGVVMLIVLALLIWRIVIWWHRNAYRRAALTALEQTGDDPAEIAMVLRRTAVAAYPRRQVARLYGQDWLDFLDNSFRGSGFADGPGRVLATAAYKPAGPADPSLRDLARRWIRHHK